MLLCTMLFGAVSCKKDDTLDPNKADFFIEANYLPKEETNGQVAPRLLVNFNDEVMMIELWPAANTSIETVLILAPDHESMMLCGNDSLMICASYDMETYTPSRDVLLVTPMDDNALVLTKCFIDWNTNTIATGDMMILPIDRTTKSRGDGDDIDSETRETFFIDFVKPLSESFDKAADCFFGTIGSAFSAIGTFITTGLIINLYSDKPLELLDHAEYPVTKMAADGAQSGVLSIFQQKHSDAASKSLTMLSWYDDGGHGKVKDYVGGNGEEHNIPYATQYLQAYNMTNISTLAAPSPPFIVNLNVGNITENSAYLKGSYRTTSGITAVDMGYIIKESDGFEHTRQDMNFNGANVMGLQKATKYTAFAYVQSMGNRVLSPGVPLWTLGFEASPSSLTFPAEGDTWIVDLSYSPDDITSWEVTSKPSWCRTSIEGHESLAVTVGETTETRSGTITITAHSNALGAVIEDVAVTQLAANNWDGTAWRFSGLVTSNSMEESLELECYLTINNVSDNDVLISFVPDMFIEAEGYFSKNYVIDGNENLVFTATVTEMAEIRVTFTRTGSTTATADFYGSYVAMKDDEWVTITGLLQGTLMNAKEIKDYKTTNNFSLPFFNNTLKND